MSNYFDPYKSSYLRLGEDTGAILRNIASRYIGQNPITPFTFRAFNKNAFLCEKDYRYIFDMDYKFPYAKNGEISYAWGKLWSNETKTLAFSASAFGPMKGYHNGNLIYKATIEEEKYPDHVRSLRVTLEAGWNHFVLEFEKTTAGFGGKFGTGFSKNFPLHFFAPSCERDGQIGWIYTEPRNANLADLPGAGKNESDYDFCWLPANTWDEKTSQKCQLERIFGLKPGAAAIGWAKGRFNSKGEARYKLIGNSAGPIKIFVENSQVFSSEKSGEFEVEFTAHSGIKDIITVSKCECTAWGYELKIYNGDNEIQFITPHPVQGSQDPWFYLGPVDPSSIQNISFFRSMNKVFDGTEGKCYWKLDMKGLCVRPYLENNFYGKWNYPLGVTLFGMLKTGLELNSQDIISYVKGHVEMCTSFYEYSLWDKENYGAAGINNQISDIDSLDDCGSFASLVLEFYKYLRTNENKGLELHNYIKINEYRKVVDDVARYISFEQSRLEDGTLYRRESSLELMIDTMWIDDLYMSVPFLCRYFLLTGDLKYVDDAVQQFFLYKKYLYMPQKRIMAHVYDTKRRINSEVPWGRGNGWVLFSLSELLEVIPENHVRRQELIEFFRNLCEGYLELQDEDGLWHQILTDSESYQEASCTSMFAYAFARGVRFGILDEKIYGNAAVKAWKGLTMKAIDEAGNVYGVCRGSGYSFSEKYYKNELDWVLNDPHGTGIVMLSGIEILKLQRWLEQQEE